MKSVTIADYGVGNLSSVARAVEQIGAIAKISSDPKEIKNAERFILPGVGAFGDGMAGLTSSGIKESIFEFAKTERPFLGICLGMQMLMESSDEFGIHEGLKLIEGTCKPISSVSQSGAPLKVPHIGWNELLPPDEQSNWRDSIFKDIQPGEEAYFVHSWMVTPKDKNVLLSVVEYGGHMITAAIRKDQFTGCQFHPEKSGPTGLKIIKAFLD